MRGSPPVGLAVRQVLHGFEGIRLGAADEADGAALDPPGGEHAWDDLVVVVQHLAFAVGDDAALLIERDAVQRRPEVSAGTVDRLHRVFANLPGSTHATLAVRLGA